MSWLVYEGFAGFISLVLWYNAVDIFFLMIKPFTAFLGGSLDSPT